MKDNLSIVISMILLVVLIVIFPLYNHFERQDDMSYNVVLKATTNFVDEVVNSGYIDQETYDKYVSDLSTTGNLYDVELEVHKKRYVKELTTGEYEEQYEIDYNDDIFAQIIDTVTEVNSLEQKKVVNGSYLLNAGDKFYVKTKNASTTMAGAVFNIIVPASQKDRIVVNYGGVIKNNAWKRVENAINTTPVPSFESGPTEAQKVVEFNYTGNLQNLNVQYTGTYKLEVWGAQGGSYSSFYGSNGGYSSGLINLTKGQNLYVYVGEFGKTNLTRYMFNGGGGAKPGGAGGGATDIRTVGGSWDDLTSLNSRIIVAGGGGGADSSGHGGKGGGLKGESIVINYGAEGGQQDRGGRNDYTNIQPSWATYYISSGFGKGATNNGLPDAGGGRRRLVWRRNTR
jgi:polyhydroxyalkanoate synthesis regulator phasin